MNFRDLEAFKAVVECGSFSRASEELFIAQPSLSKTIQKLEQKLGVKLIDRTNRIIRLTDEGKLLYEKALIILQQKKELEFALGDMNEQITGHLKIGLPQIIGTFFFPRVAKQFSKTYKDVTLEIVEDGGLEIEKLVAKGEVDAAFVVLPAKSNELEVQQIYEGHFVVCLPEHHNLQDAKELSLQQLKDENWVLFDSTFALRQIVLHSCQKEGFVPNEVYNTSQWDLLIALVREGLAVAMVPSPLVKMFGNNIAVKEISSQYIPWKIGIAVKKNRYTPHALRAFLETVIEIYK
ncbi:LysR family transcriptional regulator [Ureibacillus acetophenoni]|uniref:DNA-binding transcriptional LysR family regulator n=1 Tax=Ureibacillus acetophenoni TaxID=614649 RepID=A0A285UCW3_9BACL|nr:LysR family transcriptional regulator [Ureibacillus acetophenoni]SOC39745.1 DNA-binding transcriptional LysR family regulator [Ureibacillus acetophenoni]